MKKEVVELIEAVRNLNLRLTGDPAPHGVRISDNRDVFAGKLELLQVALEMVDKSGAMSSEIDVPEPKDDPLKLRLAIDGLMRLYQLKGGSLDQASEVIQQALGVASEEKDSRKTYDTLPNFAVDRIKRKRSRKYRTDIVPKTSESISFNSLRKMYFEVMDSQNLLGDTVRHLKPVQEVVSTPPAPKI